MYRFYFTVEGDGAFPYDMLRYDRCFPSTSVDADVMQSVGRRRVELASNRRLLNQCEPAGAKWRSTGWRVDASSMHSQRVS